jgi:hypothetical protein
MLCQQGSPDETHGTGTVAGKLVRSDGYVPPMLPIRLCSLDRVIQTVGDKWGAFAFFFVPQGNYDLVAGGHLWKTATMKGVEVHPDETTQVTVDATQATVDVNAVRDSPCSRDTSNYCQAATYIVEYEPPSPRKIAVIEGQVTNDESKGGKGLPNALISIFRTGETNPLYTLRSDKQGRFQLSLEPGTYRLTMSRKGSQDVAIPDFLVPLENVTKIAMHTRRPGAIVLCQ